MNWIIESLLMFVSSVALYLFVRKASIIKISTQYNNLAMFLIPLVLFVVMAIITHQTFFISPLYLFLIAFVGIFFSYMGNAFSLISIEKAPNPGYSLVISKSYVVFTSIVAVLFFQAELTLQKIVAIFLIVIFSGLIMLSQKTVKKVHSNKWFIFAFGSFFCWGLLSLSSKYFFNQGVGVYVFLTYMYLIVSICIILEMLKKKVSFGGIQKNLGILFLIGIFSTGFNLFQFLAISIAPNVGYVNAINASSIAAVTIFAILLFKDEFSKRKLVGVIGVTLGLLLLLI